MGQFSVRGGIIDVFPLTEELPVRIELWDDAVDSIRYFDLESQRSIDRLDEVCIYPATEIVLGSERIEAGLAKLEKECKAHVKALRDQMRTEQAHRIRSIVDELAEGLREGYRVHGLGSFIRYFSEETESFLDYFPKNQTVIFLDEAARLKEKAETVEAEFRERCV